MKKLIIVTYYWPPSGGPAVQRWLDFSNRLVEQNVEIHILTPDPEQAVFPSFDYSLIQKIDPRVKITHIPAKSFIFQLYQKTLGRGKAPSGGFINEKPTLLKKIARFVRGNFFIPDPRNSWNKQAIKTALKLIKEEQFSHLITAGPPHSTHFIGLEVKQQLKDIHWIADFHDAWTDVWYYDKLYRMPWAYQKDLSYEKQIIDTADQILCVGEFLLNKLKNRAKNQDSSRFHLVSMGYDDQINYQIACPANQYLTILYTGTIGMEYRPEVVLEALKELKSNGLEIRLRFVGNTAQEIQDLASQLGIQDLVQFDSYVEHAEIPRILAQADLLLLVSPKVKSEQLIIPGKLYEYLATKKPIINIGDPHSNTAKIVSECESGINIDRDEKEELVRYLMKKHQEFLTNGIPPNEHSIEHYSRIAEATKIKQTLWGKN